MTFWKSHNAAPVRSYDFRVKWGRMGEHTVKSVTKPSVEVSVGEYQVGNHWFKYPGVHKWNDVTLTFVDDKETTRNLIQMFIDQSWVNPAGTYSYGKDPNFRTTLDALLGTEVKSNLFTPGDPAGSEDGMRKSNNIGPPIPGGDGPGMGRGIGMVKIIQHAVVSERGVVKPVKATGVVADINDAVNDWFGTAAEPPPQPIQISEIIELETWTLKNPFIKSINFGTLDYSSDELITMEVVLSYDYCEIEYGAAKGNKE